MAKKKKIPSSRVITINGDSNIIGDNNVSSFQKNNPIDNSSMQQFLSLLESVQKFSHESRESPDVTHEIGLEVKTIRESLNMPTPEQKPTILNKLKHIEELVKTGLGVGTLSLQLAPIIEQLIHLAKTVFR